MLSKSSIQVSCNVSEVLAESGILIGGKQGTLVNELSNSVKNALNTNTFYSTDDLINCLEEVSTGQMEGTKYLASDHDTLMENYTKDMVFLASQYLSFAKNIVNGQITTLKESVEDSLANYTRSEAEGFFNVSYYTIPEIFNNGSLRDTINKYQGNVSKYNLDQFKLDISSLGDIDYDKMLLTGDKGLDDEIISFVSTLPEGSLGGYVTGSVSLLGLPLPELLIHSLINFLFYSKIANGEELQLGLGAKQLERAGKEHMDYYGELLVGAINAYETNIRTGKLFAVTRDIRFSYLSTSTYDVTIYEDNFNELVELGGNIETVFGFLASTDCDMTITAEKVGSNVEKYNGVWGRTRSLYLIHLNNGKLDSFKSILRHNFNVLNDPSNLTEAEVEISGTNSSFSEETIKLGHNYIDKLTVNDITDLDKICLELVARIKFRFSNAYEILNTMDNLLRADSHLLPKEAALYSLIDYLIDYFMQQITVSKA